MLHCLTILLIEKQFMKIKKNTHTNSIAKQFNEPQLSRDILITCNLR